MARDINESGQVVGWAPNHGLDHAFLWEDGVLHDLGGFLLGQTHATGINDAGVIIGTSYSPDFLTARNFIWRDGVVSDINDLLPEDSPYCVFTASDINNAGQIVAEGLFIDDEGYGHPCGMLLTPVPEPSNLMMLLLVVPAARPRGARR